MNICGEIESAGDAKILTNKEIDALQNRRRTRWDWHRLIASHRAIAKDAAACKDLLENLLKSHEELVEACAKVAESFQGPSQQQFFMSWAKQIGVAIRQQGKP